MPPNPALIQFLSVYSESIQALTLELRHYLTDLVPEANELIWDNYNALAMAYSKSEELKDAFCHISVYAKHVNLGFNRGAELSKTGNIKLEGKGALIRHIKVRSMEDIKNPKIEKLIFEALGISEQRNADLLQKETPGKSIVKSISEKKRRPK